MNRVADAGKAATAGNAVGDGARAVEFGSALRAARQEAGLSVADVAGALKVEEPIVRALEAEHYADLPPQPYIRGYVQRYARVVGLDAGKVLSGFNTVEETQTVSPTVLPPSRRKVYDDFARERWGLLYGGIVLVFIIVVAGALWWAWSGENAKPAESPIDEAAGLPVAEDAVPRRPDEPAVAPVRVPPEPPAVAASDSPAVVSDSSSADVPDPPAAAASDPLSADVSTAAGEGVADPDAPAAIDGEQPLAPDQITFAFDEDSWVEVRDRNGKLMHGDLGRSGDVVTLTGEAPFEILVGYADGVKITFNGDPVALEPGTRGDVARLVVGH